MIYTNQHERIINMSTKILQWITGRLSNYDRVPVIQKSIDLFINEHTAEKLKITTAVHLAQSETVYVDDTALHQDCFVIYIFEHTDGITKLKREYRLSTDKSNDELMEIISNYISYDI